MSNPLERDQKDDLIPHSSTETLSGTEVAESVVQASSNEEARERFFKQLDATEDQKKLADYEPLLDNAQLEDTSKTIDLTESIQQAKYKYVPERLTETEGPTVDQSRAERKKRLKEKKNSETNTFEESEKVTSREAMRKKEQEATKKLRVRYFPIWLRLIVILVLCFVALIAGALIGYGIIGKGNPMDVFDVKTWTHIRDVIYLKK